jgi:alginate O-acetyltransferase complex protein AlgI
VIFNSLTFLIFFAICLILYWLLPRQLRIAMLFIGSLIFYGFWRWEFVPVMLASTVLDYFIGIGLHKNRGSESAKRKLILASILVNLGLLVTFKYLYFIGENALWVSQLVGVDFNIEHLQLILPLGISFYTFQTMSYSLDVYRGHALPERNFMLYGAYVTFFPQLVAGPILRAGEVIEQLSKRPSFDIQNLAIGLKRILFGLFLKVVLADNLAPLVDDAFSMDPAILKPLDVWTMAFLFGFQIYFDFAGYSHIAIGCAKCMGIHFPENFNFPYLSKSIKSFWKRWHISLSSWIRDYLYLPLAGVKVVYAHQKSIGGLSEQVESKRSNTTRALFLTWAIMGLWHGADWTFVLWGLIHATAVFAERIISKVKVLERFRMPFIGWAFTLLLAMLSWIPFRADDLHATTTLYSHLLSFSRYTQITFKENLYLIAFLLLVLNAIAFLLYENYSKLKKRFYWVVYSVEVFGFSAATVLVFIFLRPINQFIYFQF